MHLMKTEPNQKREVIDGCAYVSGNGQLVIDRHSSDEAHLLATQTREAQPLYDCRRYLDGVFPKEWVDVPGRYVVDYVTDDFGAVAGVMLAFTPSSSSPARVAAPAGLPAAPSR